VTGLTNIVADPMFATAVGLVIYGARLEGREGAGKKRRGFFGSIFGGLKDVF
jgi:cell division ATPase FtsA